MYIFGSIEGRQIIVLYVIYNSTDSITENLLMNLILFSPQRIKMSAHGAYIGAIGVGTNCSTFLVSGRKYREIGYA